MFRLEKELYKSGFAGELIIRDSVPLSFDLNKASANSDFGVFDESIQSPQEGLLEGEIGPSYNYLME